MAIDDATQDLLRALAPRVLGTLVRRYRDFATCEDAVQEALVAAAMQWPDRGLPDSPKAWLITVATRRLTDHVRAEIARRHREQLVISLIPADEQVALAADAMGANEDDDTLELYFRCCHPALSPASQVSLTLRAVGGLTTAEIGRAFLVPEATMAQRLSRAKLTIRQAGGAFPAPTSPAERAARLPAVLHVLYLIFSEGYTASDGAALLRVDLSSEAIRVCRMLAAVLPGEPEVTGLLALMRLTDARRAARVGALGELIPLDEQDRAHWDGAAITEGQALLTQAFAAGRPGPYQIQAAIAALHDEATSTNATDWPQIVALYTVLGHMADSPMVRLSHAIALAMADGARAGISALDALAREHPRFATQHRFTAARAHLLEQLGDHAAATEHYREAARRTTSVPEQRYLLLHAARLSATGA